MRTLSVMRAALLPSIFALAACSSSPPTTQVSSLKKAAQFIYIDDVSTSPATMNDPAIVQAVERRIGDDMTRNVQLGDKLTAYEAGARSAERMVAQPSIVTDYNLRIPAARDMLLQQLRDIAARYHAQGGDNATNLLLTLESIHPQCEQRSVVTFVSDGEEESDTFSTGRALANGTPVDLPPPPGKYLVGCKFVFLGFGLTEDTSAAKQQLLPARQLASLRQGWTTYLLKSGVRPEDIEFVSIL